MDIRAHIAQHLIDVHRGGNWTDVNISDSIKDVTGEQAAVITPFSPNSIAMIIHHRSYWNRVVAQRARGVNPVINRENGMNAPEIINEFVWTELKKDNLYSAEELATVIENYDDGGLFTPILPAHSSAYKNFSGQVEHVHYHLGQIMMLKKYFGAISRK